VSDLLDELADVALNALHQAYAPYSKFRVGAAVRMDGQTFDGVNVEVASYPLSVCAERNAVAAGIAKNGRTLEAVAVATEASPPSAPCGACRQVLAEFAADPSRVRVIAVNDRGERREWTLAQLLPDAFRGTDLP